MSVKAYTLISFIAKYFSVLFFTLITLEYLSIIPIIYLNQLLRYSVTGVIMLSLFVLINSREYFKKTNHFNLKMVLLYSFFDLTFIIQLIMILKSKNGHEVNSSFTNKIFLIGISIFLLFFISYALFSLIVFHYPFILNQILKENGNFPTNPNIKTDTSIIIIRNLIFLAEIYLGSFLFLIPTIGVIISDSLITTSIFMHLIITGKLSIILPQLILEILGTAIASGTAFLIFYIMINSVINKNRNIHYFHEKNYSVKLTILGFLLSIYAFLVAWPIEISLVVNHSVIWYHAVYLFDFIMVMVYIAFFYNVILKKIFQFDELVFSSLGAGVVLFIVIAGSENITIDEIFYLVFISTIALAYPIMIIMKNIRSSYYKNTKLKPLYDYLDDNSLMITQTIGNSMKPELYANDYIIVKLIDSNYVYNAGDIITYEPSILYNAIPKGRFVTHRIVGFKKNRILTKGDNNRLVDPPIKPLQIYGIAIAKYYSKISAFEKLRNDDNTEIIIKNLNNKFNSNYMKFGRCNIIYRFFIPVLISFVIASMFLL